MSFVGVAWAGTDAEFQGFVDEHGLTFPQLSDDDGDVYDRFGIPVQPALVLIDRSGAVETILGAVDEARLEELVAALPA